MFTKLRPVLALIGLGLVAGCTSGQTTTVPFTSVSLVTNKAQLAVGVATFSDGTTGINMVTSFRQKNGESATLLNTPTITGPFVVPTAFGGAAIEGTKSAASTGAFALTPCAGNVDAGTGHVSASAQSVVTANATCSTFGQGGLALSYGFADENSTTAQAPSFIQYGDLDATGAFYGAPFYGDPCTETDCIGDYNTDADGNCLPGYACNGYAALRGGPPAFPNVRLGTYPSGFIGYGFGYTTFAMPPAAGAYNLSVNIPSGNTAGATLTAPTATMTNTIGLPPFVTSPTFVEDGAGGGTASCVAPAGVTETVVEIFDEATDAYYTQIVGNGGTVTATFGDTMGPGAGTAGATLNMGDVYEVTCIGADYPLFESGPTQNTSQTPTLVGTAGQTDIVFAPAIDQTYGVAAVNNDSKSRSGHRAIRKFRAPFAHAMHAVRT